jgi:ABC-type Zn uptake system ZnuABC Zn-binding protein ZnuA
LRIGTLFPEFLSSIFRLRIADCGLRIRTWVVAGLVVGLLTVCWPGEARGAVLRVCATTPDLGSLAGEVGGDRVAVTVFAKGTEDPHFIEARPAFLKELSQAKLYLQTGLGLEEGWAPALLQNCRNAAVMPGGPGYLDAGSVIAPLGAPAGAVDRSMGDVHAAGNPHYLQDPLNGLRVAAAIRDRLSSLDPAGKEQYAQRFQEFRGRLLAALVGPALAQKYDGEKLALLQERGGLTEFLRSRGQADQLGGWLGRMAPFAGARAAADHDMWPYFGRRFGLRIDAFLEPRPGVSPTTRHLGELIGRMRAEGIRIILSAAYFDPRHAQFVAGKAGAAVVPAANQVGSRPGAGDYLAMIEYNVRQVSDALKGARPVAGAGKGQ